MRRETRLAVALALNVAVVAGQVVLGIAASSVGLLADAGHNLTDIVALVLSLVAVRLTRRSPTPARSFGWHRSTILAAQVNATGVIVVAALIGFEAVRRLVHPGNPAGGVMMAAAAGTFLLNLVAAGVLEDHSGDLNMRANVLHMAGDAAASVGVVVAGAVVLMAHQTWADPAVSLAIGLLISWEALKLVRETTDVLLESTPLDVDLDRLRDTVLAVPGVDDVHDLHVWSLSSEVRAMSAHLVLSGHPTLEEAQSTGNVVKSTIAAPFAIAHATLELECETCSDDEEPCVITDVGALDGSTPPVHRGSGDAG